MGIGKLDRRVTFIEPTITVGTSNEDKITGWTEINTVPTVWASKNESRGGTLVENDRVVYSQTVTWMIRYRTDLNVRMRLVNSDGQVYEILGFSENIVSRGRYMSIATNLLDNIFWPDVENVLMETGDSILLETGDYLILE